MIKNRILYGLLTVFVCFLFLFFHDYFTFILLIAVIGFPFFSFFVARYVFNNLMLTITMKQGTMGENQDIPIKFVLDNKTIFPMPGIRYEYKVYNQFYQNEEIQDITLPVRLKSKIEYIWSVNSIYAGRIMVNGSKMSMRDYLGMFSFEKEVLLHGFTDIMPEISPVIMAYMDEQLLSGEGESEDSPYLSDDVTQVKEIREYRVGDRIQRVHWKLSTGDNLYVKEFEKEYVRSITLLVELKRDSSEIGYLNDLLKTFYSTAMLLLDQDISFNVAWFSQADGVIMSEHVEEEESLLYALQQIYMMESYEDIYPAYEKMVELTENHMDGILYFTSPKFSGYDDDKLIGTFLDKVMVMSL